MDKVWQQDEFDNRVRRMADMFMHKHHPDMTYAREWAQQRNRYVEFFKLMDPSMKALVNSYHKQACDALNLKLPEPFIIEKSELEKGAAK